MRLFAVLALVILIATPASAQTDNSVVGTLLGIEGAVSLAEFEGHPTPLALNAPIHMNDVIETGPGARAFILLIDDTELTLGENAQLTIDDYVFDEENTAGNKGRYSILRGAFLYTSGLIAKKDNPDVTVDTPYGAIGIRGTTFWGGEIDNEYGILVTEGRVIVQNARGRIVVDKGQGTSLQSKTSIPKKSAEWPAEKINRAVQTIALKDAATVRERIGQQAEAQKAAREQHKEFIKQRQQHKQENTPNAPTRRIDNTPAAPKEPAPVLKKTEAATPAAKQPEKPESSNDSTPPNPEKSITEPFVKKDANAETLLKTAPTSNQTTEEPQRRRQPIIRRQTNPAQPVDTRSKAAGAL